MGGRSGRPARGGMARVFFFAKKYFACSWLKVSYAKITFLHAYALTT